MIFEAEEKISLSFFDRLFPGMIYEFCNQPGSGLRLSDHPRTTDASALTRHHLDQIAWAFFGIGV
jgi:hypothetical protein